jgi:hypothetical protein
VVVYSLQSGAAFAFFTESSVTGEGCEPLRPVGKRSAPVNSLREAKSQGCHYVTSATSVPLSADKQRLADVAHGAFVETQGSMKAILELNLSDIPGASMAPGPVANDPAGPTAYDVQNNFQTQVDLGVAIKNYVTSLNSQLAQLQTIVRNFLSVHFLGTEWQFNVYITMPDGSKVQYDLNSQSPDANLVSAKDPRGLPVLAVGSGAAMGYLGSGEFARDQDASNFLQNMIINGVPVIERPGHIGNSYVCWRISDGIKCRQSWMFD